MIVVGPVAQDQIGALSAHYRRLQRLAALRNLILAVEEAKRQIQADPAGGARYPRIYPDLADIGYLWIKVGRYWFAYERSGKTCTIGYVFFDEADIPGFVDHGQ